MMMVYGLFVFSLSTAAYQELQRQTNWRHEPTSRVGRRPARQYLGPGDDTITLDGTLLPEFTGGQINLEYLRRMAEQGAAWPLVEGTGWYYGAFAITSINERKTRHFYDGAAQNIEFTLTLNRVDDRMTDRLGRLDSDALRLALETIG